MGLDVVRTMVQSVGGHIQIHSGPERGTSFQVQLPVTLSVLRAVIVEIAGEPYAFPHNRIDRLLRISRQELRSLENRQYIEVDGQNVGIVIARQVLQIEGAEPAGGDVFVVLLGEGAARYGLVVDSYLGEQDLVVRPMERRPCPILVVTATVAGNYALVCEAMSHGAFDAVATPVLGDKPPAEAGAALLAKLNHVDKIRSRLEGQAAPAPPAAVRVSARTTDDRPWLPLVAIGASTGGPQALRATLSKWPRDLPAATVVAQHISADFAGSLVAWLSDGCRLAVRTASNGDRPQAGVVLVAGTDDHLVMRPDKTLVYTKEPIGNPFRPSVDVLFQSLAQHWPSPSVGVLLTGIGRDGTRGLLELRRAGWHTIAQDQRTSVVYGMPQAASQLSAAVEVLPIGEIAADRRQVSKSKIRHDLERVGDTGLEPVTSAM